jgi:cycloeucalenol cycloisomerase
LVTYHSGLRAPLADSPAKAAAERFYLAFTPIWGGAAAWVMLTGRATRWGDVELNAFAFSLYALLFVGSLIATTRVDRGRSFFRRYAVRLFAMVSILALLGNYFGTRTFYEVLDMHYGFRTSWNLNHVPLFLYPLTAVYFATYAVVYCASLRLIADLLNAPRHRPPWFAPIPIAFSLAFLETALNANPWMRDAFCYGSQRFSLGFGTLLYGTWFLLIGPIWYELDEGEGEPSRDLFLRTLSAMMAILVMNEVYANLIAPHFTTVVPGRIGTWDAPGPTCIER